MAARRRRIGVRQLCRVCCPTGSQLEVICESSSIGHVYCAPLSCSPASLTPAFNFLSSSPQLSSARSLCGHLNERRQLRRRRHPASSVSPFKLTPITINPRLLFTFRRPRKSRGCSTFVKLAEFKWPRRRSRLMSQSDCRTEWLRGPRKLNLASEKFFAARPPLLHFHENPLRRERWSRTTKKQNNGKLIECRSSNFQQGRIFSSDSTQKCRRAKKLATTSRRKKVAIEFSRIFIVAAAAALLSRPTDNYTVERKFYLPPTFGSTQLDSTHKSQTHKRGAPLHLIG